MIYIYIYINNSNSNNNNSNIKKSNILTYCLTYLTHEE